MSSLLALGPLTALFGLFVFLLPFAVVAGLIYGIVKLIKFAWKN